MYNILSLSIKQKKIGNHAYRLLAFRLIGLTLLLYSILLLTGNDYIGDIWGYMRSPQTSSLLRIAALPENINNNYFSHAQNGKAFISKIVGSNIYTEEIRTSLPVYKFYGVSANKQKVLYSPLKDSVPSGELYIEHLQSRSLEKLNQDYAIEATWSSSDENMIAYTFSSGTSFGVALINLRSKIITPISTKDTFPNLVSFDRSGGNVLYYQEIHGLTFTSQEYEPVSYQLKSTSTQESKSEQDVPDQNLLPAGFPRLLNINTGNIVNIDSDSSEIIRSFRTYSPNQDYEITGEDFIGYSNIWIKNIVSGATFLIGEGKLVNALQDGIILQSYSSNSINLTYITYMGEKLLINEATTVTHNLPLKSLKVTQAGVGFSPSCKVFSDPYNHTGSLKYGYDMQGAIGAHVLATAEGRVVYTVNNVKCNSYDGAGQGCADYVAGCTSNNGGWGNTVIIEHSDGSWTKYSHLEQYSIPAQVSVNSKVCQGQYIGNQGHTGNTAGNVNGCGDHLHYQKQMSSDLNGQSISVDFEGEGTPLSCGIQYQSKSTEVVNCSCSYLPGQGSPSSSELAAFQASYNSNNGLGCAVALVRTTGYTSFKGTSGHWQNFNNGDIEYHTNGALAGQAFAVINPFYNKYASYGFTTINILGYPITNASTLSTSKYGTQFRYQAFEGGALEQILSGSRAGNIFEVHGAIYAKWGEKGYTNSALGVPWSDESPAQPSGAGTGSTGKLNQFEGGQIYWISNSPKGNSQPAFEVHGAIYDKYVSLGGSAGWLGFPISDEYVSNGFAKNDFEGGYITTLDGVNYQAFRNSAGLTISLVRGWNLISLPLQPTNNSLKNVLSGIEGKYASVWAWNTSKNDWDYYRISIFGGSGSLTTMTAGRGYWIEMKEVGTLPITGTAPSKTISLTQGWNLVGLNSSSSISRTNAMTSLNGQYDGIWAWNTSKNDWDYYRVSIFGGSGNLTELRPGAGYWIYAKSNAVWSLP